MNWVDLLIIVALILFVADSIGKSFLGELLDFLSFLVAFALSLRFYDFVSQFYQYNFQVPHSLALVLGFVTIWFLVEAILFMFLQVLLPKLKVLPHIDDKFKYVVFIPAFFRGVIFISIILVLVGTFPIQPRIKQAVQQSTIGSFMLVQAQQLETPFKSVFGGLTNDTLAFFTVKPKSDESIDLGFQTAEFKIDPEKEKQMIALVNKERKQRGLKELEYDARLTEVGRFHSGDMFKRGYFSHYSPEGKTVADRANQFDVNYLVIGENLAYAPSLELAHTGLMNSEGHRANILSEDYNKIGIGIMDGDVYGLMITQVFSN